MSLLQVALTTITARLVNFSSEASCWSNMELCVPSWQIDKITKTRPRWWELLVFQTHIGQGLWWTFMNQGGHLTSWNTRDLMYLTPKLGNPMSNVSSRQGTDFELQYSSCGRAAVFYTHGLLQTTSLLNKHFKTWINCIFVDVVHNVNIDLYTCTRSITFEK